MTDREREDELVRIEGLHEKGPSYDTGPADAIVVGAGPAGSVAALLLARRGLRVVLLDRAAFPRPKACGDCLSAAATALLHRHGLLDRLTATAPAWLEGWSVTSPGGRVCTGRFRGPRGLAMERRILDAELRAAALEAGARPLTGRVVDLLRAPASGRVTGVIARGTAGERPLRARLVIGADGLRSIVARRLGTVRRAPRLRKVSLTTHVPVSAPSRFGQMYLLEGGCVGFAPVGRDRANLTLVVDVRFAPRLARIGPVAFLREWLARVPRLEAAVPPEATEPVLASGPFDWPSRGPVAHGAALVGDAAGYYDPFTGQGVFQAMAAAEALAREVGPALDARPDRALDVAPDPPPDAPPDAALDAALARYARAHRRLTRSARRLQRGIEAVVSRPRLADRALARLARAPLAMDRLVAVTGDLRGPAALLSPAVLSSFLFPSAVIPTTPEAP